jgi:hypothetical protein
MAISTHQSICHFVAISTHQSICHFVHYSTQEAHLSHSVSRGRSFIMYSSIATDIMGMMDDPGPKGLSVLDVIL